MTTLSKKEASIAEAFFNTSSSSKADALTAKLSCRLAGMYDKDPQRTEVLIEQAAEREGFDPCVARSVICQFRW